MTNPPNATLAPVIAAVAAKIQRFRDRLPIGEENTKMSLIQPILEALGWDVHDPDEVHYEFRHTAKDNPVDYALKINRIPQLFVEAKGLGEDLTDHKWIGQVLGYATMAGVPWCVLTDGDEYRFYNATVAEDAEHKLLWKARVSEGSAIAEGLNLISRKNLEEKRIEAVWNAYHVDRRVGDALRAMLDGAESDLVKLVRKRAPGLAAKSVAESIRRLAVRIDSPTPFPPVPPPETDSDPDVGPSRNHDTTRLADLITAGLLRPPLRLFRTYKDKELAATLRPDGAVEFAGRSYSTCSAAGEAARATVTGERMNTNGWTFWQFIDGSGQQRLLSDVRTQFLRARGQGGEICKPRGPAHPPGVTQ